MREAARSRPDIADAKKLAEDSREVLDHIRREIADVEISIEESKATIAESRRLLKQRSGNG
jgi:hypothetical protein